MAPTLRLLQHLIEQETANEMLDDRITDAPRGGIQTETTAFEFSQATRQLVVFKKNADGIFD